MAERPAEVMPIGRQTMRGKFLFAASMLTVALALVVGSLIVYLIRYQHHVDHEGCLLAVAARDDARAMFVWVGEAFPDADFSRALAVELNRRLPRLECSSSNIAVPIED